jgi:hypothetical protein
MTFLDFLTILLTAAALHRIWNYEAVGTLPRAWAKKTPYLNKPLLCPACNAFWFGVSSLAIWKFAPPVVGLALISTLVPRLALWVYKNIDAWASKKQPQAPPALPPPIQTQQTSTMPPSAPAAVIVPIAASYPPERTVVILTTLGDFNPSYSLSSAVLDQARAIAMASPTWAVQVWVLEDAIHEGWRDMPGNVQLRKIVPRIPLEENIVHEENAERIRNALLNHLSKLSNVTIITHDLLFVSWYATMARAIHKIANLGNYLWFHVAHSLPSYREGKPEVITTLPRGRHYVTPVAVGTDQKYADYYQTDIQHVVNIPNVKDPRTWGSMTPRLQNLVTKTRLMEKSIVQIFPVCTTRLEAKGFSKVVQVFAELNKHTDAFLLICNPNAGGDKGKAIIKDAKEKARLHGLPEHCWAFTSEILPDTETYGLTASEIKELMHSYGNLFVFPSVSEADSLVVLEAALARQYIIGNEDVQTLRYTGDFSFSFGNEQTLTVPSAQFIVSRILDAPAFRASARKMVLRDRHLEGIGNRWRDAIVAAGP